MLMSAAVRVSSNGSEIPYVIPEEDVDGYYEGEGSSDSRSRGDTCLAPNCTHPTDACVGACVRVVCNSDACREGNWMHDDCFTEFESRALAQLNESTRAQAWSPQKRRELLWTRTGYDLVYKTCACRCRRGFLRKDLTHKHSSGSSLDVSSSPHRQKTRRGTRGGEAARALHFTHSLEIDCNASAFSPDAGLSPVSVTTAPTNLQKQLGVASYRYQSQLVSALYGPAPYSAPVLDWVDALPFEHRSRTSSLNSTGSSQNGSSSSSGSPSSVSTPYVNQLRPVSLASLFRKHLGVSGGCTLVSGGSNNNNTAVSAPKTVEQIYSEFAQATTGNMFVKRHDLSVFNVLPKHKRNSYHIKMEDDGPHGNDETRSFVLSSLSRQHVTTASCALCDRSLPVYDKYPLIDGSFYITPVNYHSVIPVKFDGRAQHLNAVCLWCMEAAGLVRCKTCDTPWDGSMLLVGSMYAYDIFAASPCCRNRVTCKHCRRELPNPVASGLNFYSAYSRCSVCVHCSKSDNHFVRPLHQIYVSAKQ